jgi:predicted MFS family arabinose efflux permease
MRSLIRLPGFLRLAAAYTLNELAVSIGTVALAVLIYRRTGSAIGSAGFFLCAQGAPALLSPIGVARLERIPPRIVLPALYALEAILYGALAWLTARFSLVPVLAIALLDGAVALTARSLAQAARVEILKPADRLREGNALTNGAFSLCFMAGPLIGGLLVAVGDAVTALIVAAGLFAAMALSLLSDTLPMSGSQDEPAGVRLRSAIRRLVSDRPILTLVLLETIGTVFFTISVPIEVIYASHTLHAGASGYGELQAAWGAGAVVGSIAFARWRRSSGRALISAGGLATAVGFGVLAVAPDLPVALGGGAVAGIGNAVVITAMSTELQDRTPLSWMALISSVSNSASMVAPALGIVLGGTIAALSSTRVAFGVAGVAAAVFALVALRVLAAHRMVSRFDDAAERVAADGAGASLQPPAAAEPSRVAQG